MFEHILETLERGEPLAAAARFGIEHRRVPRLHGAERATSGRAHCRSCRELIAKDVTAMLQDLADKGCLAGARPD